MGRQPADHRTSQDPRARVALRQALGFSARAGNGPLLTRPPGYVLHRNGITLDLVTFGSLTVRGRELSAMQAWAAASGLFAEALALWRGNAYADVTSRLIRSAAAAVASGAAESRTATAPHGSSYSGSVELPAQS